MSVETNAQTSNEESGETTILHHLGVATGAFSVIVVLTAIAYYVMIYVVDSAVDLMNYHVRGPIALVATALTVVAIIVATGIATGGAGQ